MEDFFREFEECLRGEVTETEYQDSLQYYRNYFKEEMAKGLSEQEVAESLGSPRLIAKSIIDAQEAAEEVPERNGYYDVEQEGYEGGREERPQSYQSGWNKVKLFLIVFVVLLLLGTVVRILLPIALFLVPLFLIIRLFSGDK
ncbi:MAG: DUF1700 domain-containing protein [Eubacteriales bacterium]|nr:DUF1700 domain-containing protein [Eubacteriales bacterium]